MTALLTQQTADADRVRSRPWRRELPEPDPAPVVRPELGPQAPSEPGPGWHGTLGANGLAVVVAAVTAVVVDLPWPAAAAVASAWALHLVWQLGRAAYDVPAVVLLHHVVVAGVLAAGTVGLLELDRTVLLAVWAVLGSAGLAVLVGRLTVARPRPRRVVVVGLARTVSRVSETWHSLARDEVVGGVMLPERDHDDEEGAEACCRRMTAVVEELAATGADTVLCEADGSLDADELRWLCWMLEDTPVRMEVSTPLAHVAPHRIRVRRTPTGTVAAVTSSRPSAVGRLAKMTLDRVGAAVLLVVLSPVMVAVAALVRLDSPGPALFRQVRVGRLGRTFTMLKFRTMVPDAEAGDWVERLPAADDGNGVLFKLHDDPRVTRVGAVLRRTSLDELPQLVNVLRGEMSLVGPRPALPREVAAYDARALRRLQARPGLTGLWQVSGRSDLAWDRSLALDLDYTDNITLGRDLTICLATVRAVVGGRGAY